MTEATSSTSEHETLYCAVHTNVETTLRCNKCGRPMCPRCAVQTPVGYRCKECVRGQQQTFYNSQTFDPIIQLAIGLVLGLIGTALISLLELTGLGFGFFGWLIAFWAGSGFGALVADLAHRAVGKRRGKYAYLAVSAGIIIGGLIAIAVPWVITYVSIMTYAGTEYLEQTSPLVYMSGPSLTKLIFLGMSIAGAVGRLRFGGRVKFRR